MKNSSQFIQSFRVVDVVCNYVRNSDNQLCMLHALAVVRINESYQLFIVFYTFAASTNLIKLLFSVFVLFFKGFARFW